MTTNFVLEAMMQGGGLRLWLFMLCAVVGIGGCGLIFWVTIRHHVRRDQATMTGEEGEDKPVIHDSSLLAEIFWVLIPMLMILGLAGWALFDAWPASAAPDRNSVSGAISGQPVQVG